MAKPEKFRGIFPALLTPFDAEGRVDEAALRALIAYNLTKGVHGFYVGGSTAEAFLMDPAERRRMYEICADAARGKCSLIAHVGDMSVKNALAYAKMCEQLGYDAVSSVTPIYYKYGAQEIIAYYKRLADASSLPVLMYHIPALSGVTVGMDVFDTLFADRRILGVKFTGNDFFTLERLRRKYPDKILYNGYDEMLLSGLAMGADGGIGSTYNLMGELFVDIWNQYEAGNLQQALPVQHRANDVIADLLGCGNVMAALKAAMTDLLGLKLGECLEPIAPANEQWRRAFAEKYAGAFLPL